MEGIAGVKIRKKYKMKRKNIILIPNPDVFLFLPRTGFSCNVVDINFANAVDFL